MIDGFEENCSKPSGYDEGPRRQYVSNVMSRLYSKKIVASRLDIMKVSDANMYQTGWADYQGSFC